MLAVGGVGRQGNVVVWDTLASEKSGPIARLSQHASMVTALQVYSAMHHTLYLGADWSISARNCRDGIETRSSPMSWLLFTLGRKLLRRKFGIRIQLEFAGRRLNRLIVRLLAWYNNS